MSEDATFGLPETRLGLIPDVGGSTRLPAVVGLGNAKELIMTGRTIGAQECLRIGAANRVVPAAGAGAATQSLVDELLAASPIAVGLSKRVLDGVAKPTLAASLEQEVTIQQTLVGDRRLPRGRRRLHGEAPAELERQAARPAGAGGSSRAGSGEGLQPPGTAAAVSRRSARSATAISGKTQTRYV